MFVLRCCAVVNPYRKWFGVVVETGHALSLQHALSLRECITLYLHPMKILMVCLGNICRSPLAEGILQEKAFKAGLKWSVESAGTNGYHNGEAPHHLSQKVANMNGIDISRQRSRRFRTEDFNMYDKIYVMAQEVSDDLKRICGKKYDASKVELLMNEVYPGENRDVPDPWYGPEPGYHEVYKMIDKACDAMVNKYSTNNDQYSMLNERSRNSAGI